MGKDNERIQKEEYLSKTEYKYGDVPVRLLDKTVVTISDDDLLDIVKYDTRRTARRIAEDEIRIRG